MQYLQTTTLACLLFLLLRSKRFISRFPPAFFARRGTSPLSPARIPDLIGIKERRYLDAAGLIRHRSIGDLMRHAALNQGMDMLGRYGDFIPAGTRNLRQLLAGDPTNSAPSLNLPKRDTAMSSSMPWRFIFIP
jgi:hypothetical protein